MPTFADRVVLPGQRNGYPWPVFSVNTGAASFSFKQLLSYNHDIMTLSESLPEPLLLRISISTVNRTREPLDL
jgi:hypothetical protein